MASSVRGWQEWVDGIVSGILRNMSKKQAPYSSHQSSQWLIFDGDIDAEWIEVWTRQRPAGACYAYGAVRLDVASSLLAPPCQSMNSVMDDNKMLTLVSNERIPLTKEMRLLFEIHSLEYASPATVSRAGMVFVNDRDVKWNSMVRARNAYTAVMSTPYRGYSCRPLTLSASPLLLVAIALCVSAG